MRLLWPLVGRSEELRNIGAALSAPDVSGIVVCGAAGVGKSRVARAALAAAADNGSESRWVLGTSSGQAIPLGAFNAWIHPGATDTVELLRGVVDALTSAPSGSPVVVGVDDAHLLDDLSAFVVHQIAQRGTAKVLLTIREGASVPAAVHEIRKAGRFDRIDLQPLALDETTALVSAALDGTVDADAARRLWALTRGNALYLRNIVEQELTDGRIVQQHGRWRWVGEPAMPPGLVELIESRIGALSHSASEVIDVLAVGEPIGLEALTRIAGAAAVEEADTRGLITLEDVAGNLEVRVAHPLYGEIRRRRAPQTRLRRLRGLVATELAATDDCNDIRVLVRRATLSLDSDLVPDDDLLVRAAHGAIWLADLPLAVRLAAAVVDTKAQMESTFLRAHALSWLGQGEEADAILANVDTTELTDRDRARLAFLRASNILWTMGAPARAKKIIDDASCALPEQDHSYIDAFLTVYWFAMDQPDAAMQASQSLALDDLPAVAGTEITWALTTISGDAGRTTDAAAIADIGYAAAQRSFDAPQMWFNIADGHAGALLLAGRISEAIELADRVRRQASALPGAAQLLGAAIAGRAAIGAGRVEHACELLEQAATGLSCLGYATGWGYRYRVSHATALAMRGATTEAAAALCALDKLSRPFRSLDYEFGLARAWIAAGQGAVREAIDIVLSTADGARRRGQFAAEVLCLQSAVQFGEQSGLPRLRELETLVEGPRVGIAARFAAALHDGDGAELDLVSVAFEGINDIVAAVDAAAHAALAHRRRDLRGSALGSSVRAHALAKDCGASTAALRQAAEPVPMTDREREIVMLIGSGLSNREVAERLTLSVRTVESHIYRAMVKTRTTNREQLAALLYHHGRPTGAQTRTTFVPIRD